jgi:hypothetical protein
LGDELFSELVESIKEAGAYLRGEQVDVRVTILGAPDSGGPNQITSRQS